MDKQKQSHIKEELERIFVSRLQSVRSVRDTVQAFSRTDGGWIELYAKKEIVLLTTLYDLHYADPRPLPLPDFFGIRHTPKHVFYLLHYNKAASIDTGWWYIRENGSNVKLDLSTRRRIQKRDCSPQPWLPFPNRKELEEKLKPYSFKDKQEIEKICNKYEQFSVNTLRQQALEQILFTINNEDVFISYSRKDVAIVQQFESNLRENGISVWWDKSRIYGGASIWREIHGAIESSKVGIVFLSHSAVGSEFVRRETRAMLYKHHQDPIFAIIPVLLKDQKKVPKFMSEPVLQERVEMAYIEEKNEDNLIDSLLEATKFHLERGNKRSA